MRRANTDSASENMPAFLNSSARPYCGNGSSGRCVMNAFSISMREGGTARDRSDGVQAALGPGDLVVTPGDDPVVRVDVDDDGPPGARLGLVVRLGEGRDDDDVAGLGVMGS